jgi:phosphoglycolate phosphatase-like HAD superfamily hydrolase
VNQLGRPTVLLFDLDGTLLSTGGAGRRALERAFSALYGAADACAHFRLDGMTDRAIVRTALERLGVPPVPQAIDDLLATYVALLTDEVARVPADRYRILPGVSLALDMAESLGAASGLGTGNIREGARLKLERVDLFRRFPFGGFGCDAEDRAALLRSGAERGASLLGEQLDDCRVMVIGDTPKDVAAAHAMGAECLGVATGSYSVDQLFGSGAEHVLSDLGDTRAFAAILTG